MDSETLISLLTERFSLAETAICSIAQRKRQRRPFDLFLLAAAVLIMFISTMAGRYRLPWIIRCYSSLFHLFWQAFISYSCSPAGHAHSYVGPAELCYFLFNYNCIRLRFKTAMQLNCFALHYSLPSAPQSPFLHPAQWSGHLLRYFPQGIIKGAINQLQCSYQGHGQCSCSPTAQTWFQTPGQ